VLFLCYFFFQAEDGIRDFHVTGVQTCALPISLPGSPSPGPPRQLTGQIRRGSSTSSTQFLLPAWISTPTTRVRLRLTMVSMRPRSEERRVGKECRSRRSTCH